MLDKCRGLENDRKYVEMITETSAPKTPTAVVSNSAPVQLRNKIPKQVQHQLEKDDIENKNSSINLKICKFETIARISNPTSQNETISPRIVSPDGKAFAGEKFFTKGTATTRVSANFVQGERLSTGSVHSISSISSQSSQGSDKLQIRLPVVNVQMNGHSSPVQKTSGNISNNSFEDFVNNIGSDDPILGSTKAGSPRSPKGINLSPKLANSNSCDNTFNSNNNNIIYHRSIGSPLTNIEENKRNSDDSNPRHTFDGLDVDFNELTEMQQELTIKHREVVVNRKQAQEQAKLERHRLDEILTMFAEYEQKSHIESVSSDVVFAEVTQLNDTKSFNRRVLANNKNSFLNNAILGSNLHKPEDVRKETNEINKVISNIKQTYEEKEPNINANCNISQTVMKNFDVKMAAPDGKKDSRNSTKKKKVPTATLR